MQGSSPSTWRGRKMKFQVALTIASILWTIGCTSDLKKDTMGDSSQTTDIQNDSSAKNDLIGVDTGKMDTQIKDTKTGTDITIVDISTAEDAGLNPDMGPPDPCEGYAEKGSLKIGAPCTEHSQCQTGYCYDEAWKDADGNNNFRFCTISCVGCPKACADWESSTYDGNTCLPFLSAEIEEYSLTFKSICLPKCFDANECKTAFNNGLTTCAVPLHWDESTFGAAKVCLP